MALVRGPSHGWQNLSRGEFMTRRPILMLPILIVSMAASVAAEAGQGGDVLTSADMIAFVGTTDAERAKVFYQDKLGLRLVTEEPSHALVFDAGGTMLRVSVVAEVPPVPYTVLGWRVGDIAAAVESLVSQGVVLERFPGFTQDSQGVWTAPDGTRVAWFKDPDGNMLSLTQFPVEGSPKER